MRGVNAQGWRSTGSGAWEHASTVEIILSSNPCSYSGMEAKAKAKQSKAKTMQKQSPKQNKAKQSKVKPSRAKQEQLQCEAKQRKAKQCKVYNTNQIKAKQRKAKRSKAKQNKWNSPGVKPGNPGQPNPIRNTIRTHYRQAELGNTFELYVYMYIYIPIAAVPYVSSHCKSCTSCNACRTLYIYSGFLLNAALLADVCHHGQKFGRICMRGQVVQWPPSCFAVFASLFRRCRNRACLLLIDSAFKPMAMAWLKLFGLGPSVSALTWLRACRANDWAQNSKACSSIDWFCTKWYATECSSNTSCAESGKKSMSLYFDSLITLGVL